VAADGSVYTTGYFSDTVDFDPGPATYNLTSARSYDVFISKLDSAGNFVWARRLGGTGIDFGHSLTVAGDGSVYTTGYFDGTGDFDPGPGTFNLTSLGGYDVFISKLDSAGNFVWAKSLGGPDTDIVFSLAVAADGSVYTTGAFYSTADFDPGPGTFNLTSAGDEDAFVSKLDSGGHFVWARRLGGKYYDYGQGLAVAADGSVYTTGAFQDTADFDPCPGTFNLTSAGGYDVFVSKLLPPQAPTAITLSIDHVLEDQPVGTAVGVFSATDLDSGEVLQFSLVAGAGDTDNAAFTVGDKAVLLTKAVFDFHTKSSYSIRVRAMDHAGLVCDQVLTVTVVDGAQGALLGGRVWRDLDGDGIQDAGEPGMAGVGVEVFSTADSLSRGLAVTDANGSYALGRLSEWFNYYEVLRAPVGYTFTIQNAGTDPALDSDADPSGVSAIFTVVPGSPRTLDAGLVGAAPWFGFGLRVGASTNDYGYAVATDAAGNEYVTGYFSETADFDPGPGTCNLTSVGGTDIFVAKFSAAGALLWARSLGGTGVDCGNGIAVASDGSVYTTGCYQGTADFDPGLGTFNLPSAGTLDVFVSKLDSAGNFGWARGLGGTGDDSGNGLAVVSEGSVYTTGYFNGTVDFDPGPGTFNLTSAGSTDVFVSKLDAAGNFVWARGIGGTGDDSGNALAVAADGSIYTTGSFWYTADFDPGPGTFNLTSAGYEDVFISKLDSGGNIVWARRLGGTSQDYSDALAVTSDGSVYTTGSYAGTADFDPGAGIFNLTSAGSFDVFVSKLNSSGNFVWVRDLGGTDSDVGHALAVASDGGVYTTGCFNSTADFDPGPGTFNLTSAGLTDVFVCKLNSAGSFVWARRLGGTNYDYGKGLAVASDGSVYTTGRFMGTADFDPGPGTSNLTSAGNYDVFVSKLVPPQAPTTIALSNDRVLEGQPAGTPVGAFSATGVAIQFSLVPGSGDADNGAFTIVGNLLLANGVFDFQTKNSYSIRVRATDHAGLACEQVFTVTVVDGAQGALVGGRVWRDLDGDGIQDAGEPGMAGVGVEVFATADRFSRGLAVTDANGGYSLGRLSEWFNYYEVFRAPVGYTFTIQNAGTDPALDSDADPSGVSAIFTVAPGSTRTLDAGLVGAAPWFGFAFRVGASSTDYGYAVATDAAGNEYVTGHFADTVDFDPGPGTCNLTSAGATDIFVAKFSVAGALLWARSLGGTGVDCGNGIAVASDGSVYTTGTFYGTADFDPGAGTFNLTGAGLQDVFVWKLNSAGNFVWARRLGGTESDYGRGLAVASDGSVYTTGSFHGTADFDPGAGTFNLTSAGNEEIFVSKLDSGGNFVWARRLGGTNYDYGRGVAVASDGSVYTTGAFEGTADFDPGPGSFNLTSAGDEDVFVSKLDSAGNFVWARGLGGANSDIGSGLAVASDGNVYTTGYFRGPADFDPGPGTFNLTDAGQTDVFVSKLNSAGNFVWARRLGGTNYDYGQGIAVASDGSVYTTGAFQGTADFDPGPGTSDLTSAGYEDVFVSKLLPHQAPKGISLGCTSVAENQASGTAVGAFSTPDPEGGNTFTYTRVSGAGSADNASFRIVGNTLQTAAVFDYEAKSSYSVRVRTTDQDGLWYEEPFTISVTNVNEAPTDIALSNASVAENQAPGTAVGTLTTTDPDADNTFTYTLVPGAGDTDNAAFTITGTSLETAAAFDYEAKSSYSVRVRATDQGGLWTEMPFTISVTNVNDAPVNTVPSAQTALEDTALTFSTAGGNAFQVADVDIGTGTMQATLTALHGTLTLAATENLLSVTGNGAATVVFTGTITDINAAMDGLTFLPAADYYGPAEIQITTDDQGNTGAGGAQSDTDTVSITVMPVNDAPTANDQSVALAGTGYADITLTGGDQETPADQWVFAIDTPPAHGTLTALGGGQYRYTAETAYLGPDSFTFTVTDDGDPAGSHQNPGDLTSRPATVSLIVEVGDRRLFGANKPAKFVDESGDLVSVLLTGKGSMELLFAHGGRCNLGQLILHDTTAASSLSITVTGTKATGLKTLVGEIDVQGSLGSLTGRAASLKGDLTVSGTLGRMTLDELTGGGTIKIGGTPTVKTGASLAFTRVKDTSLTSEMPVASLTATEWLDTGGPKETISAPRLGSLAIKGDKTHAGDFAANLTLQGLGLTGTATTLASATIKGSVPGTTWDLTGPVGTVTISGTVGEAGTPWQLTGPSMVGTLTLGDVTNGNVTVSGAVGAVKATRWQAGAIQATKAASIATMGLAKPPVIGDFGANVTLSGVGVTGTAKTLGSASIKGNVVASIWDLTGPVGTLAITGTVGTVAQPWQLVHPTYLGGLTLGDVTNATVNVSGESGAVKAVRWLDGSITAAKIASITTTGIAGTKTVTAILGDLGADVTLAGSGTRPVLGMLSVQGWLDAATINSSGPLGKLTLGGMRHAVIRVGDTSTPMLLDTLTINGIRGETYACHNFNVSAWAVGTVTLRDVLTDNAGHTPQAFGVQAHTVARYTRYEGKAVAQKGSKLTGPAPTFDPVGDYSVQLV
jgi:hypothetical protein